jgi:CrcB protein
MSALVALTVIVAGGLGSVLRYGVSLVFAARSRETVLDRFPWAVLAVNSAGSLLAGIAAGLAAANVVSADARLIIITGLAGGLTTFSTFTVETVELFLRARFARALISFGLNLALGIALATGGFLLFH